jgi:hypothetical protein
VELLKQAKETDTKSQPQPATKKATKKEDAFHDFIGKSSERRPQPTTKKEDPVGQAVPKGSERRPQPTTKQEDPFHDFIGKSSERRPSPATEQERRLEQLERKLDQILEELKSSKPAQHLPNLPGY